MKQVAQEFKLENFIQNQLIINIKEEYEMNFEE